MADVKDGDIVFEYPDDDEITGNKLPDEKEIQTKSNASLKKAAYWLDLAANGW